MTTIFDSALMIFIDFPEGELLHNQCCRAKSLLQSLKASPEEKRNNIFFKEVPVESVVDQQAIEECKNFGLYNLDPCFRTGKMSQELKQKMGYMKSKHRTDMLLRKWSQD